MPAQQHLEAGRRVVAATAQRVLSRCWASWLWRGAPSSAAPTPSHEEKMLTLALAGLLAADAVDHATLAAAHEKMEADHKTMEDEHAKLEEAHLALVKEHDQKKGTAPDPKHDTLEAEHQKIIDEHRKLLMKHAELVKAHTKLE